jgi:hypothetical protein
VKENKDKPRVWTFYGDETEIEAELLGAPRSGGLCELLYNGVKFVRHVRRIVPINESAHILLAGVKEVASDLCKCGLFAHPLPKFIISPR